MSEPVDYRDLLRKYMQHVRRQEGTTCMSVVGTPAEWLEVIGGAADDADRAEAEAAACGFTDDEIAVLREIEKGTTR